jgi:hypothetical protein
MANKPNQKAAPAAPAAPVAAPTVTAPPAVTPAAPAAPAATPAAPVASVAPAAPLYVAVGPKRGLTGNGGGAYSNVGTMLALQGLPGATTTGLPLTAYHACAKQRNHASFVGYAVKNGWLALATAPVAAPVVAVGTGGAPV